MKSGIYKITSPTGRIYIGSSKDVKYRITYYKKLRCKSQTIIYSSLLKYGADAHKFEIIEYCELDVLLERERYYCLLFNVLDKYKGLNCQIPSDGEKLIEHSEMSKKRKSDLFKGERNPFFGKTHSEETKKILSFHSKSRKPHNKGVSGVYKASDKAKENMKKAQLGRKHNEETLLKMTLSNKKTKIVLNFETGVFYFGSKEAALAHNIKGNTLRNKLNLNCNKRNNTNLLYV